MSTQRACRAGITHIPRIPRSTPIATNRSCVPFKGRFLGHSCHLSKPVNKLELLKRVENMLKLRYVTDELQRLRSYIDGMEEAAGPQR